MISELSSASKVFATVEAKRARLRYSSDEKPGIRRKKSGQGFYFVGVNGRRITDRATIQRIKHLAIPPAWTDVWICPIENGHIQATGRDARGRKQYRYHERWREQRDETKYARMLKFARVLPKIRRRMRTDLRRRGMPREKVLATIVRLLESTLIRVGNDEYARENRSYGLTTMRNRHVSVHREKLHFTFRGKSGKKHEISVYDRQLARIVKKCQEMPGQELFAYEDENGAVRDVDSQDVNDYLREITGDDFTAKDFRTWAGTVLAAIALREFEAVTHRVQLKRNINRAVKAVARVLGNTPTVCRQCYIHPEILESYLSGNTITAIQKRSAGKIRRGVYHLSSAESAVLVLLQSRLKRRRNRS